MAKPIKFNWSKFASKPPRKPRKAGTSAARPRRGKPGGS